MPYATGMAGCGGGEGEPGGGGRASGARGRRRPEGVRGAVRDWCPGRCSGWSAGSCGTRAQSEEVSQEVLLELWRSAGRFDPARGSALSWILTLAHRRAVDRVRSARAAGEREQREASGAHHPAFDQVAEEVEAGLEREWVRRCLDRLTTLQRQSVTLAYYDGYTYREVAERLSCPLGTVKTRMRDGLTRLRECLGGVA